MVTPFGSESVFPLVAGDKEYQPEFLFVHSLATCTNLWNLKMLPCCRTFCNTNSRFLQFEKKWLGLDKISKITKIKCHEISPFKNREINLSQTFPTIRKLLSKLRLPKGMCDPALSISGVSKGFFCV